MREQRHGPALRLGWCSRWTRAEWGSPQQRRWSLQMVVLHMLGDDSFRHLSAFNHTDKKLEHKYCCLRDRGGCGRMKPEKYFLKFSLKLFIIGEIHMELVSWNRGLWWVAQGLLQPLARGEVPHCSSTYNRLFWQSLQQFDSSSGWGFPVMEAVSYVAYLWQGQNWAQRRARVMTDQHQLNMTRRCSVWW